MDAPTCPHCGKPITRALDAALRLVGVGRRRRYELAHRRRPASTSRPWVHYDCMGELREFHPQDPVHAPDALSEAAA